MIIPKQLQDPSYRFFLVGENKKLPIEKSWNLLNCYPFFHERLLTHIKNGGNYGLCTGPGGVIVIDFDDRDYYNQVAAKLPATFTVLSAGKRLPHLYYILKGEMFKKIAIMDENKKVLADIQADRVGIVGPGSKINRRYYSINNHRPLTEITQEKLVEVFNIRYKYRKEYTGPKEECPIEVDKTINGLIKLGVKRTGQYHFQCFKHPMAGKGNLSVFGTGQIYCFHCQSFWSSIDQFKEEYEGGKN